MLRQPESLDAFVLGGTVAYIIANFVTLSLIRFRRRPERNVLLAHVLSFLLLATVGSSVYYIYDGVRGATVVAALSLHAIYSFSYLELWALSEGSLSLRILSFVAEGGPKTRPEIVEACLTLIKDKRVDRVNDLLMLRTIRKRGNLYELTRFGKFVSNIIALIGASARIRETG